MESYLNITIRVAKAQAEAALASLRGELNGLNSAMRSGGSLNTSASTASVDRLTGSLRSAGYALSATFTAPLLAAGHSLLDFQLQNETAMADLKKVYGDNPLGNYSADIEALGRNFKALSNEYGVNQTEVIKIGAAWAAAGVQGAALAQSVDNTLKAMVIGDLNSTQATEQLISIQGQYRASASDLTKILSALNVVENTTAISMEGLISGFQRAAGAAANGGVTYRELAALLAAITPYAGSASQAGNSLKTIISNLEAPSAQASDALKNLGINIADAGWKSATATDKLREVAKGFMGLSDAQKNVEARALSGAFQVSRFDVLLRDIALSLNGATRSQSVFARALDATVDPTKNARVAQQELQTVLDSNPRKLQIIGDMMKNNLADVLVKLIPLIIDLAAGINVVVTWFSNLNPNVQKTVGIFLLVMAALGPVLLYLSAMRDVLKFGGEALNFFLTPLKLIPGALSLILAPGRAVLGVIGWIGGLFSTSGRAAEAGAVQTATAMELMVANIETTLKTMLEFIVSIWQLIEERTTEAGRRVSSSARASFTETAAAAEEGMTTAAEAVAVGGKAMSTEVDLLGGRMVTRWMGTWGYIYDETVVGMTDVMGAIASGMAGVLAETEKSLLLWNAEFAAAQMRNLEIIDEGFLAQVSSTRFGMRAIEGETIAGGEAVSTGLLGRLGRIPGAILGFFTSIPGRLVSLFSSIPGAIVRVLSGIGPALLTVGRTILGALTGPVGVAIAAVLIAVALFRKQIEEGWDAIVSWFKSGASGIGDALAPLVNIFYDAINLVIKGFDALPQGVQNALMAVVSIVESAAKAVYNLFSYLNPWAHHSPSLVENVTTGMQAVIDQFNRLTDVSAPIDKAYNDIKRFGQAVAGLQGRSNAITVNTDVSNIRKAGGGQGAVNAYLTDTADVAALTARQTQLNSAMQSQQRIVDGLDAQIKRYNADLAAQNSILNTLQDAQSAAQEGMSKAQADLQKYQSYGITGQKAMSDAIFNSQMKEKELQLQMMKIEDVTGPMQDVQSYMQALQGSMDALRGTSKSLREAGASRDITGVYDAQVTAMQGQYDATKNQVSQYDALNKQLTDAQRKTQELQLQDSITYDPLTKQINDAANAMKELPFDQILKGVTDSKAALDKYTAQYNVATNAVKEQQEVIKGITAARDALQSRYDTENAKLDQLKKAYQDVGQAISDVNAQLQAMMSSVSNINQAAAAAASAAKGAKGKAGTNLDKNFAAGAGGNFPSALGTADIGGGTAGDIAGIDKLTKAAQDNLQKSLGKLNPFGGITKKWDEFKGWWSSTVAPGFSHLWESVTGGGSIAKVAGDAWNGLTNGFKSVLQWLNPLFHQIGLLVNLFKPDFIKLWHDLRDAFLQIGNDIGPKLLPLFRALGELISALWPIIKLMGELAGVFLVAQLKIAADIFVNVFGTALHAVIAIIGDVIQVITGIVEIIAGAVNIIIGLFTGDWNRVWQGVKQEIHGLQDVVEGTFMAIWHIIEGAGKLIYGVVKGIVTGIVGFFEWLYDVLVGHSIIPDLVNAIFDWFSKLPGLILTGLEDLGKLLLKLFDDAFNMAWKGLKDVWNQVYSWLTTLAGLALKGLEKMGSALYGWAKSAFNRVLDGFKNIWNSIAGWLGSLIGNALRILSSFGANLYNWAHAGLGRAWDGFRVVWNSITGWLGGIIWSALHALGDIGSSLYNWARSGFGRILDGYRNMWSSIGSWLGGLGSRILSSIGNLGNLLYNVGSDIVGGIRRGIEDAWQSVVDSITGLASHLPGPIKKLFNINSPSRLMADQVGGPIAQGIGMGITNQTPFVMNTLKNLGNAISAYKFEMPGLPSASGLPTAGSFAGLTGPASASIPAPVHATTPAVTYHSEDKSTTLHIEKVEFPNITSSSDAQKLLDSLEALANGSR